MTEPIRNILVVAHAHREETVAAAHRVLVSLAEAGVRSVLPRDDQADLRRALPLDADIALLGVDVDVADIELAIVLGGDGTILRATELVRDGHAPVLGINMGHVGSLPRARRTTWRTPSPAPSPATTRSRSGWPSRYVSRTPPAR